jgi:hypothetical protein
MIKDLYFIDLAKSSQVLLTLLLHLPVDDSHFGCQFFLKNPPKKSLFKLAYNSDTKKNPYLKQTRENLFTLHVWEEIATGRKKIGQALRAKTRQENG